MFSLKKFEPFDYNRKKVFMKNDDKSFLNSVSIVIDQYDSQEFNLNDAGWPRNDIAQLARAQSKSEFDAIMSRIVVRDGGKSNIADGMTDQQIYDTVRSRYVQSPLELEMFAEYSNGSISDYLMARYGMSNNTDDVKQTVENSAEQTE